MRDELGRGITPSHILQSANDTSLPCQAQLFEGLRGCWLGGRSITGRLAVEAVRRHPTDRADLSPGNYPFLVRDRTLHKCCTSRCLLAREQDHEARLIELL